MPSYQKTLLMRVSLILFLLGLLIVGSILAQSERVLTLDQSISGALDAENAAQTYIFCWFSR